MKIPSTCSEPCCRGAVPSVAGSTVYTVTPNWIRELSIPSVSRRSTANCHRRTNIAALYAGNVKRGGLVIGLIIAAVGLLLTVAGYVMILVAAYRALVKIDALPVRQQPRAGQGSPHSTSDFTY